MSHRWSPGDINRAQQTRRDYGADPVNFFQEQVPKRVNLDIFLDGPCYLFFQDLRLIRKPINHIVGSVRSGEGFCPSILSHTFFLSCIVRLYQESHFLNRHQSTGLGQISRHPIHGFQAFTEGVRLVHSISSMVSREIFSTQTLYQKKVSNCN